MRTITARLLRRAASVMALIALDAGAALGLELPGQGKIAAECYAGLEVDDREDVDRATDGIRCLDQVAVDGACRFRLRPCANRARDGCTPSVLTALTVKPPDVGLVTPPTGSAEATCGEPSEIVVPLDGRRVAKRRIVLDATVEGRPRRDRDRFVLRCLADGGRRRCGRSLRCPATAECPENTAGGPDELIYTVLDTGTDLDNGWTGISHNFPVPSSSQLRFCLSGCDDRSDPSCDAQGATGPDTPNGRTFGPPLPLVAGSVPVCVVNRFDGPISGTANVETGEMAGTVRLLADVFISDATRVCPRCSGGRCDSGANANGACTVDGRVTVAESLAANKLFELSRDCPPAGSPAGTLRIELPLTTGTSTVTGSRPCREREAQGVTVRDDACGAAGCGGPCQPGSRSCVTTTPNPANPSEMVCVDAKGGLSQTCCKGDAAIPCFPTRDGPGIVRTGRPLPPEPPWATDRSYPKTATGVVAVATFCEAATTAFNVDQVAGLPGPGALVFNTHTDWCRR